MGNNSSAPTFHYALPQFEDEDENEARLTLAVAATCSLYTDQIDQRGHADMSGALVHNAIVLMDLELG